MCEALLGGGVSLARAVAQPRLTLKLWLCTCVAPASPQALCRLPMPADTHEIVKVLGGGGERRTSNHQSSLSKSDRLHAARDGVYSFQLTAAVCFLKKNSHTVPHQAERENWM